MLTFKENNRFCYLWGMPILITKLDPKEYNKHENFPVPDYTQLIKAYQIPTQHYIQKLGFNTSVNVLT